LDDYITNLQLSHIYAQNLAHKYFPDVVAEVKHDETGAAFLHFATWTPPRSFDPGEFSKKVSLELPSKEFARKINQLFLEVTEGLKTHGN